MRLKKKKKNGEQKHVTIVGYEENTLKILGYV